MGGRGIARIVRRALFSEPCTSRGLDSFASPKAHPSESLQCLSLSSATSVWPLTTMRLGGTLELWLARPRPSKDVLRHLPGGFLSFSHASLPSASHMHHFLSLLCLSHASCHFLCTELSEWLTSRTSWCRDVDRRDLRFGQKRAFWSRIAPFERSFRWHR